MKIEDLRFKEQILSFQKDSPPKADAPMAQNPRPEFIPPLFGGRL